MLHVDGDKNEPMVRAKVLTKKLGQILDKLIGGGKVFAKRAQGKVYLEWTLVARLALEGPEGFDVEWNLSLAEEIKTDKAATAAELRKAGKEEEDASWGYETRKG